MRSTLLLLTPFVAYVNAGDCANAAVANSAACKCNINTGAYYGLNNGGTSGAATDECAIGKTCFKGYGAASGAKDVQAVCMTPLTAACANVDGSAAIASGCQCAAAAAAGVEVCFGDESLCFKHASTATMQGGANKMCRQPGIPMVVMPSGGGFGCAKSGGGGILDHANYAVNVGKYCAADGTVTTLPAGILACGKSGGAKEDGNDGSGACALTNAQLCAVSGAEATIAAYDVVCTTSQFCIRGINTAAGGLDAKAGFANYFGSPACAAAAPATGNTACKVGVYAAPNSWCKSAGSTAKYCGHGWSSKAAAGDACEKTGVDACDFKGTGAVGAAGCVCVNPGDKKLTTSNACASGSFCLTTELVARTYHGIGSCVASAATAEAAVTWAANTNPCKGHSGDVLNPLASTTAAGAPCGCGLGAICGPGTYCLMANETALATDNDTCLTSAIGECTMDGSSAASAGCKCGDSTTFDICGTGQFCLFSNSTAHAKNGGVVKSTTAVKSCMTAAITSCIDSNSTTAATAPCWCADRKDSICATGEFCNLNSAANTTTCAATATTSAPTAAPVAPTAAPTAAASSGSPVTPFLAFAVTMLSLAISALM